MTHAWKPPEIKVLAFGTPGIFRQTVPPGSGERLGVDRDQDGVLDRDELDVGSDPADAASGPPTPVRTSAMTLRDDDTVPVDPSRRRLSFRSARYQGMASGVVVPAWDGPGDPTAAGASAMVETRASSRRMIEPLGGREGWAGREGAEVGR